MKTYQRFLLLVFAAIMLAVTATSAMAYGPVVLPTPCNTPYVNYGGYYGGPVMGYGGWVKVHYRYHEPYSRWYNEYPAPRWY